MSTKIEPLVTIDELDAMPEDGNRYELVEGEIIVSRAPGLHHQEVLDNVIFVFKTYLRQNPVGKFWSTPGTIFSEMNAVIPDIVFVSNARIGQIVSGQKIVGPPDLVIEITSPGSDNEKRDRITKRQLYGKYGVLEYWVIDSGKRYVEVYFLVGETLQLMAAYSGNDEITSPLLPGFTCSVNDIFNS